MKCGSSEIYRFSQGRRLTFRSTLTGLVNDVSQRNISYLWKLLSLSPLSPLYLTNSLFPLPSVPLYPLSPLLSSQHLPLLLLVGPKCIPLICKPCLLFFPLCQSLPSSAFVRSSPNPFVTHFIKLFNLSSLHFIPLLLLCFILSLSLWNVREREREREIEREMRLRRGWKPEKGTSKRGGGQWRREGGESKATIKEKETPERVLELNRRLNRINIELRDRRRGERGTEEEEQADDKCFE